MADIKTGSKKYADAVNKATGNGTAEAEGAPMAPMGDAKEMVGTFDQAEMEALAASGGYEFAPQILSLEPGQKISGVLEGNGPDAEFEDKVTKEVRHVKTWIIANEAGTLRVSILSSAQLDSKLPPFVGGMVVIARGPDVKTSNNYRVGNYYVGGPRRADGKPRVFSQPAQQISAPAQQALPSGDPTASAPTASA